MALLSRLDAAMADASDATDAAFRADLLAYEPALRRFALSLTRDPTASDDLVQDTLLRAWRSRDRFQTGTYSATVTVASILMPCVFIRTSSLNTL